MRLAAGRNVKSAALAKYFEKRVLFAIERFETDFAEEGNRARDREDLLHVTCASLFHTRVDELRCNSLPLEILAHRKRAHFGDFG